MHSLVLLSGGVESTTLLHLLAADSATVRALFVDYGQRAAAREGRRGGRAGIARLLPRLRRPLAACRPDRL
jgi:7-cyano-7-deazaguanine synthase in queuosine biosynthesis